VHELCAFVHTPPVRRTARVNVFLGEEHAVKLRRLAERSHTNPGTVARSLLSAALDEADPDATTITGLLDGIDGAFERAEQGRREAEQGLGTPLEEL
jgi:hypothetical protein